MQRCCPIFNYSARCILRLETKFKWNQIHPTRGTSELVGNRPSIWAKTVNTYNYKRSLIVIKSQVVYPKHFSSAVDYQHSHWVLCQHLCNSRYHQLQNFTRPQICNKGRNYNTGSIKLLYGQVHSNKLGIRIHLQQIRLCSSNIPSTQPELLENDSSNYIRKQAESVRNKPKPFEHIPDSGKMFTASQLRVQWAAPHQLNIKPDADNLVFGKQFTDHMLKVYWHKSLGGWQSPEITPIENLMLHPAAKVLHYAFELFEGMKAYRGVDGRIRIFRPIMNMNRMNLSAQRTGLPNFIGEELVKCLCRLISIDQEWIPHTESASLYIRPTLIGIDPKLGINSLESALLYVILSPVSSYFKTSTNKGEGGLSLLADPRYTRAWPGGVGDRKMGSNYAPTIHVQHKAANKGLHQVLWLYGEDHQLTEVGTMNIFIFYVNDKGEKELRTPPLNGIILPGITRDSVLSLARQWGRFKVIEGIITMPQVCQLVKENRILEIFGTGTACIVSPVKRIHYLDTDILIPTMEQDNSLFGEILTALSSIQYGKIKDHPWAVSIDG